MIHHPNKLPFFGRLCYVDKPSDKSPTGARGKKVRLLKRAVENALPTLIGTAINYDPLSFGFHSISNIAGIITDAEIIDNWIVVSGYIFKINLPDLIKSLRKSPNDFGMSYEMQNGHVVDMRKSIWDIEQFTFVGASIILKNKCAYSKSSFELSEPIALAAKGN